MKSDTKSYDYLTNCFILFWNVLTNWLLSVHLRWCCVDTHKHRGPTAFIRATQRVLITEVDFSEQRGLYNCKLRERRPLFLQHKWQNFEICGTQ